MNEFARLAQENIELKNKLRAAEAQIGFVRNFGLMLVMVADGSRTNAVAGMIISCRPRCLRSRKEYNMQERCYLCKLPIALGFGPRLAGYCKCPIYVTKKPGHAEMNIIQPPEEYRPEMWTIAKDHVYAAISAIQIGVENTQDLLAEHDKTLGRSTRKNRLEAERLEKEIEQMRATLAGLRKLGKDHE